MQKLIPNCLLLVVLGGLSPVMAQTKLDLRTQSRNVDFTSALSTKPFKTGDFLPAICAVGELFFRTNSPAGKNLHGCTTTNAWTAQSVGSSLGGVLRYIATFSAQTSLTITSVMHGFDSPDMLVTCYNAAAPAALIQPTSVTIDSTSFSVSIAFSAAQSGRCILNAPGVPSVSGEGIVQNGPVFSVDPATVPSFLTVKTSLAAWTISAQSCADRTLPLLGAGTLDAVVPIWPVDLPASLSGSMFVSAAEIVTIRLCNFSLTAASLPVRFFGAAVIKSF